MTITPIYEISDKNIQSVLITALAEGSTYWYEIIGYEFPTEYTIHDFVAGGRCNPCKDRNHMAFVVPFAHGGTVKIANNNDGSYQGVISRERIRTGLTLLANEQPQRFARVIMWDYDASDADALLQYIVMGKNIYG